MFTKLVEKFRTRVLLAPQTTATETGGYLSPTPGAMGITLRAVVKMGNSTDLTISLNYADDTNGTNATAFSSNVPIYINGAKEASNAKAYTASDSTGNFIIDFCIDPALVPQGKTIGLAYANSNAANLISAEMIEDVAYKPTES